jgi:D-glycero-D-manno-heptose 1,7-bisphosphate phosphatase
VNPPANLRPGAFLDRDGTIIREKEYLADPDGVEIIEGVPEALRRLRNAGFVLVVVTNQSGIAKGFYTVDQYRAVADRLDEILEVQGVKPDATLFCPHHPDFTGPCDCRKPATGMHRQAAAELGINLGASIYVGDRKKDALPALELGGRGFLVRTGYGPQEGEDLPAGIEVAEDLPEVVQGLLGSP